jgi:hypothetical protein
MKVFALLRKEKNKKRRDIARREQELLSRQGREQFKKLLDFGLPISVSV